MKQNQSKRKSKRQDLKNVPDFPQTLWTNKIQKKIKQNIESFLINEFIIFSAIKYDYVIL